MTTLNDSRGKNITNTVNVSTFPKSTTKKNVINNLKNDINLLCLLKENKRVKISDKNSKDTATEDIRKKIVISILNDITSDLSKNNHDSGDNNSLNIFEGHASSSYIVNRIHSNLYKSKNRAEGLPTTTIATQNNPDTDNSDTKYQTQLLDILLHITGEEKKFIYSYFKAPKNYSYSTVSLNSDNISSGSLLSRVQKEYVKRLHFKYDIENNISLTARKSNIDSTNSVFESSPEFESNVEFSNSEDVINVDIDGKNENIKPNKICNTVHSEDIKNFIEMNSSVKSSDKIFNENKSVTQEDSVSLNIHKFYPSDNSSCTYLEKRPGRLGLHKQTSFQEYIFQETKSYEKYVEWSPNQSLLYNAYGDPDEVKAIELISSILSLRSFFIRPFQNKDSIAVSYPLEVKPLGQGSNEPIFDPYSVTPPKKCSAEFKMDKGVYHIYWNKSDEDSSQKDSSLTSFSSDDMKLLSAENATPIPSVSDFFNALDMLMSAVQNPACKTFAFRRLQYLKRKFDMHRMFNGTTELQEIAENKHRDFYNIRKVDTHVHHSACMHQKHLLRFIRKKYKTEPDQIVASTSGGKLVTLKEIFQNEIGITAWESSVDSLNVHALGSCFYRFDLFNLKYNPFGQPLLREVFLKTDNYIQGRYLAEITKEVIGDLQERKYEYVEWRISIYGKARDEWSKLASWVEKNCLQSKQVRWMIQIPRLYNVYRRLNLINSFADLLSNIFEPLLEAIKDPESYPSIYHLLLQLNGWDSVDDESIGSKYTGEGGILPLPEFWTDEANPPYSYWAYYIYANIQNLNAFLYARGLRILPFRPHCGEVGSISHLASMYLLADGINHGIMLKKAPVLQYLFYLHQIGLAVSPLSNNALFQDITKNPFNSFFEIGMNVSLSSDDPLLFHYTNEPLLEEYSCSAHVWKLSTVDLCEIARNSVLQSHFEPQLKRHWLGVNFDDEGPSSNNINKTNVSNVRLKYRYDTLINEFKYLRDVLSLKVILDECSLS